MKYTKATFRLGALLLATFMASEQSCRGPFDPVFLSRNVLWQAHTHTQIGELDLPINSFTHSDLQS